MFFLRVLQVTVNQVTRRRVSTAELWQHCPFIVSGPRRRRAFCYTAGFGRPVTSFVAHPLVGLSRTTFCRAHELDRDFGGDRATVYAQAHRRLCARLSTVHRSAWQTLPLILSTLDWL